MRKLLLVVGGIILAASLTIMVSGCGSNPCQNFGGIKDSWQSGNIIYYICNDGVEQQVDVGAGGGGPPPDDSSANYRSAVN
jgi:hypothetical protein